MADQKETVRYVAVTQDELKALLMSGADVLSNESYDRLNRAAWDLPPDADGEAVAWLVREDGWDDRPWATTVRAQAAALRAQGFEVEDLFLTPRPGEDKLALHRRIDALRVALIEVGALYEAAVAAPDPDDVSEDDPDGHGVLLRKFQEAALVAARALPGAQEPRREAEVEDWEAQGRPESERSEG